MNIYKLQIYASVDHHVIVLRLLDDSVTDLHRDHVYDKMHAIFRCNKARVIEIYDKSTKKYVNALKSNSRSYYVKKIIANKDEGIAFYLSKEAAFFHDYNPELCHYFGIYKKWHDDGSLYYSIPYINGKKNDIAREFCCNVLVSRVTYIKGQRHGKYEGWFTNGNRYVIATFANDKLNGTLKIYHQNGKMHVKATFTNDIIDGDYEEYYQNGNLKLYCIYTNRRCIIQHSDDRLEDNQFINPFITNENMLKFKNAYVVPYNISSTCDLQIVDNFDSERKSMDTKKTKIISIDNANCEEMKELNGNILYALYGLNRSNSLSESEIESKNSNSCSLYSSWNKILQNVK